MSHFWKCPAHCDYFILFSLAYLCAGGGVGFFLLSSFDSPSRSVFWAEEGVITAKGARQFANVSSRKRRQKCVCTLGGNTANISPSGAQ